MKAENLPDWDNCRKAVKDCNATKLQQYIYDNEPAGIVETEKFRSELAELITEIWAEEQAFYLGFVLP